MMPILHPLASFARYHWPALIASLILAGTPGTAAATSEREVNANVTLIPGEMRQQGAYLLREWQEPASGIALFRIECGYTQPVLNKINAALERQHRDRVAEWKDCAGYEGGSGVDVSEARFVLLTEEFVSYAWFSSWGCAGAAHPDFDTQGFTFDARTGRELTLEDVLYLGGQPAPKPETSSFYDYRSKVFSPQIIALFKRLYPSDMAVAEGEAEEARCDYADPSVWEFPSWYLIEKGLYLGAHFWRAQRPCDEPDWSIVPWDELTQLKPGPDRTALPARPDVLQFGAAEFAGDDVAKITQTFDDDGFPVLDIALQPDATTRLHAETIRLVNTDITVSLGDTTLIAARLVEPIAAGQLRISGRFSLAEMQVMAGRIICALKLSSPQYDPPSLSAALPCQSTGGERTSH